MVRPAGRAGNYRAADGRWTQRVVLVSRQLAKEISMRLDIRTPIGIMFALLGVLLAVFGIVSDKAIYQRSLGYNVNLWWGLVMIAFGAGMWWLARRGAGTSGTAFQSPEGRKVEEREKRTGIEKDQSQKH
jgi:protein-S-isoprenylcysteine O-methyltransferase Ste14